MVATGAASAPAEITVVVHACRWPPPDQVSSLFEAIRRWEPDAEIVEARERPHSATGAAALVNRAAAGSHGRLLLCLQPHVAWTPAQLEAVRVGAADRLCRARAGQAPGFPEPTLLWGIPRHVFDKVGGLDPRFWSVGEVDDLEARLAAAGSPTRRLDLDVAASAPESYPLKDDVRRFLAIRNRLLTAFRTLPADELGRLLSIEAPLALERAWRAAGIGASAFRMGARHVPGDRTELANEADVLIPLLALDSALSEHVEDARR